MKKFLKLFKIVEHETFLLEQYAMFINKVSKSDIDNKDEIIKAIKDHKFLKNNKRLKKEDINISKILANHNYSNILNVMKKYDKTYFVTRNNLKKNIVIDNGIYEVYKINNYTECEKIARGADWCISRSPGDHTDGVKAFKKYIKDQNAELYIAKYKGKINNRSKQFISFIYLPKNNKWVIFNGCNHQITSNFELKILFDDGVPLKEISSIYPNANVVSKDMYVFNLN